MSRFAHTIYLGIIGILTAVIAVLVIETPNGLLRDPSGIAALPFVA